MSQFCPGCGEFRVIKIEKAPGEVCPCCGWNTLKAYKKVQDFRDKNLSDINPMAVDQIVVLQWHRDKDGKGKPEQVHLLIPVNGLPPMIVRLKSRRICEKLIEALKNNMEEVFPE